MLLILLQLFIAFNHVGLKKFILGTTLQFRF